MPEEVVAMAEIGADEIPPNEQLLEMYHTMYVIRRFEETANELYMEGRVPSTLHLYIGQEAVATGVTATLRKEDYVWSTHRPHGHALAKGVQPEAIMAELFGKATGSCAGKGGSMHVGDMEVNMPPAIAIVGGNTPLAAGTALAQKMQGRNEVTVSYFGEGATNEGAWHEAVNAAAIWSLPVIFVCENNLYAASTPFDLVSNVESVADRACAYGIPGVKVDGNDVLAVYKYTQEAVERARRGEGPTLIECLTYRQCGHSRSDPLTYRSKDEEKEWESRDPILRFRQFLLERGKASEAELDKIEEKVEQRLEEVVAYAADSPEPDPDTIYTDIFKE